MIGGRGCDSEMGQCLRVCEEPRRLPACGAGLPTDGDAVCRGECGQACCTAAFEIWNGKERRWWKLLLWNRLGELVKLAEIVQIMWNVRAQSKQTNKVFVFDGGGWWGAVDRVRANPARCRQKQKAPQFAKSARAQIKGNNGERSWTHLIRRFQKAASDVG
jgi:hypothetical protein